MARAPRIQFEGAVYHLTSRGNCREDVFFSDQDRWVFLKILGKVVREHEWICHAYCLMTNHYHLLIETPRPNLSRGMHQLNGGYTQYVNHAHSRTGHLFQGRFKSILIQKDSHLIELSRYIVLNPVRAGMCAEPEDYMWSSFRATLELVRRPGFLKSERLLSQFSSNLDIARCSYRKFVSEGKMHKPWDDMLGSGLDLTPTHVNGEENAKDEVEC